MANPPTNPTSYDLDAIKVPPRVVDPDEPDLTTVGLGVGPRPPGGFAFGDVCGTVTGSILEGFVFRDPSPLGTRIPNQGATAFGSFVMGNGVNSHRFAVGRRDYVDDQLATVDLGTDPPTVASVVTADHHDLAGALGQDINDHFDICGFYSDSLGDHDGFMLRSVSGTGPGGGYVYEALVTDQGCVDPNPKRMNDARQVVGYVTRANKSHLAFVVAMDVSPTVTLLGDPNGLIDSEAYDVNDFGLVCGRQGDAAGFWDLGQTDPAAFHEIVLPDSCVKPAMALGIDNAGNMVGWCTRLGDANHPSDPKFGMKRAFVYRKDLSVSFDLNESIDRQAFPHWILGAANGMNEEGDICGVGVPHPGDVPTAFRLRPQLLFDPSRWLRLIEDRLFLIPDPDPEKRDVVLLLAVEDLARSLSRPTDRRTLSVLALEVAEARLRDLRERREAEGRRRE